MNKCLTFYEYDGFERESGEITDRLDLSGLSSSECQSLEWLSRNYSISGNLFDISQSTIRARQFIGTVSLGNKSIQILPKLLRAKGLPEKERILKNLLVMLEYAHEIEEVDMGTFRLAESAGNFIEVYIHTFAKRLVQLLRRHPPKNYVNVIENTCFLKGRILFPENVRKNLVHQERVICEFDEFTEDNLINQAFRSVVSNLINVSSVPENRKLLQRASQLLEGVQQKVITYSDVRNLQIPKKDKALSSVFSLAKMFIRYTQPELYRGQQSSIAILIDMNELFEDFIFQLISKNRDAIGIKDVFFQKGQRLVSGLRNIGETAFTEKNMFNTYQDIVVEFENGKRLTIDTKYKLIGDGGKAHFGISNADVYQILTYRELNGGSDVMLLYPRNEEDIRKEFRVTTERDVRFSVLTVNLGNDMRSQLGTLVQELRDAFVGLGLHTVDNVPDSLSQPIL